MYLDFSVSECIANFSEKAVTIATNFTLDKTTINKDTVKFFKVVDGKNEFITDYALSCNGKNIVIELSDYPYEGEEFYLFAFGVRDKLGRELNEPYMKTIVFSPNIGTKLFIQSPEEMTAFKTKKIHVEVTILDDDEYTLKLIDNPSDIVLFSESDLDEMLQLGTNTVLLQVATDDIFMCKEEITFEEHEAVSTNPYKVIAENIARVGNTLSFDLVFFEDQKHFIRVRLQSRENKNYFGSWSNTVSFMIKSEDIMNASERYLNEMLFSEVIFEDEYKELDVVSMSDDSHTDQEFYIEFNKPVKITKDMATTEDGLVLIATGFIIRRDF